MHPGLRLLSVLPLPLALGCPMVWPGLVTCEEQHACGTTEPTTDEGTPTTSVGVHTVTGDDAGDSGSTAPDAGSSGASVGTSDDEPVVLPVILGRQVMPDFTQVNALLDVTVEAEHADGVRMALDDGSLTELMPLGPGAFTGQIAAFTGLDNGKHTAVFTPWRDALVGEAVGADYTIGLPPPGFEVAWDTQQGVVGSVAAIAVLPDGRPVEFGTSHEMGVPRCYLRLRDKSGEPVELVPVLPSARCTAIDLTIDRDSGVMHVLLERESGDGVVWWVGEISGWGLGPNNLGTGEIGDKAFALASRPGLVAVCGSKAVASPDKTDALAMLLQPGQTPDERSFDYKLPSEPVSNRFAETARDCKFAGDTLVLVGEAYGRHDDDKLVERERLTVIEYTIVTDTPVWTVAGPGPGVQSRGLAVDIDDGGRYHLAGYTCLDDCEPEGEVRIYEPGGKLVGQVQLGLLGSSWFGPHDIAWSPAGYAVVALGRQQGESVLFEVEAYAPGVFQPLWTFTPNDKEGFQVAFAVAVGAYGEVYAGGTGATNHPAFAVIGG